MIILILCCCFHLFTWILSFQQHSYTYIDRVELEEVMALKGQGSSGLNIFVTTAASKQLCTSCRTFFNIFAAAATSSRVLQNVHRVASQ